MRKAIENYYKKLKKYPDYYIDEDFSEVSREIRKKFKYGIIPIKRTDRTDISIFKKVYGYDLPEEIDSYINLFWHTSISGCAGATECIILFDVLKKEGDGSNDVLFYKFGLMDLAKDWVDSGGDIQRYIPIGWLGYSGCNVVYEVKTGNIYVEDLDVDGLLGDKPIAGSLKELINNMVLWG